MPRLDQLHGHEAQAVPRVRLDSAMCRVDCAADRDEDGTGAPVAVVAECVEVTELERVADFTRCDSMETTEIVARLAGCAPTGSSSSS